MSVSDDDDKVDTVMRVLIGYATVVADMSNLPKLHARFPGKKENGAIYLDRARSFAVSRHRAILAADSETEMTRLKSDLAFWLRTLPRQ